MRKVLVLLCLLFLLSSAYALSAPEELRFASILPGGYAEKILEISDTETSLITASISGPVGSWLSVSPAKGYVNSGWPFKLKITVNPPTDALPGTYAAYVTLDQPSADSTTIYLGPPKSVRILVDITQTQTIQAQVKEIEIFAQENKIVGLADVENTGNTNIIPRLVLEIEGQQASEENSVSILPTKVETVKAEFNATNLANNVYDVKASVYLQNELLRQDIIPVSLGKSSEGELVSLSTSPLSEIGKATQITALFKNDGENEVLAQLKVIITRSAGDIEQIESDKIIVQPHQTANLTSFFVPQESDTYAITGYVVFDSSATPEKQIALNVQSPVPLSLGFIGFLAIGIMIALLAYAAKFKKRKAKAKR